MKPQRINLPSGGRVLAINQGNNVDNFTLDIDLPITSVVVGQARRRRMLGGMLFRPVPVKTINFSHSIFGREGHVVKDAKRAMRAKIQHSDRHVDQVSKRLERYSWAALLDVAELANADAFDASMGLGLNISAKQAELARQIVEITVEKEMATTALAAASYSASSPDLDVTVSTQWNDTGGDSKTDVRAVAKLLAAQHGVQLSDITAYITDATLWAIQEDPTFLASRSIAVKGSTPLLDEIAEYWGIGGVVSGDAYESNAAETGVASMYGDVCILKLNLSGGDYDLRETAGDSFCDFSVNGFGVALTPWLDNETTSWFYPWERWSLPATVDTKAAAILRDTAL